MMRLTELLTRASLQAQVSSDPLIKGISAQSSRIEEGFLFVAKKGATPQSRDGHEFIEDALRRGASGLIVDDRFINKATSVPVIRVPQSDLVYAHLCEAFYDFPSHHLNVIGITGTNGKTSTSFMLHRILEQAGFKPMVMGTLGCGNPQSLRPVTHTTMEAEFISKELSEALSKGINHVIMEVSSHALSLNRTAGLKFCVVGLSNITQDHLDFHGTFEAYKKAKAQLFFAPSQKDTPKILPTTPYFSDEATLHHVIRYNPHDTLPLTLPLLGEFHTHNANLAKALAKVLGIDDDIIHQGLENAPSVPGRLELISHHPCRILVDFAHTPDALERVLQTLRKIPHERIILVMGCGGNRDTTKRSIMGSIAEKLADKVIITDDNPRHENPQLIREAIVSGMQFPKQARIIPDRALAIKEAIKDANSHDIVIIAGKGHENYQIYGDEKREFSDQIVAKKVAESICQK